MVKSDWLTFAVVSLPNSRNPIANDVAVLPKRPSSPSPYMKSDYRAGAVYSAAASLCLATQQPFSSLAAKDLTPVLYLRLTQAALLLSIPLLLVSGARRRDFISILTDASNLWKQLVLFAVGLAGLLLYNIGLSNAHPLVVAATLNLSPFWAALVAFVLTKKRLPVSRSIFFLCWLAAFLGAMMIAWSQTSATGDQSISWSEIGRGLLHGSWVFAIPIPVFYALSGALVHRWFSRFDESSAIAVNFLVSGVILIPLTFVISWLSPTAPHSEKTVPAALLLMIGTLAAAVAGRIFYQIALTRTDNDNGFVTMFFLSVPGVTSLVSLPLSWWIPDLHFTANALLFGGLFAVAAPLLFFSLRALR